LTANNFQYAPKKAIFFLFFPLIACLFSCTKDGQKPSPPPSPGDTVTHVTAVTVDPAQLILIPAMTTQLKATVAPINAPSRWP